MFFDEVASGNSQAFVSAAYYWKVSTLRLLTFVLYLLV